MGFEPVKLLKLTEFLPLIFSIKLNRENLRKETLNDRSKAYKHVRYYLYFCTSSYFVIKIID
jgi:hypothetical protein